MVSFFFRSIGIFLDKVVLRWGLPAIEVSTKEDHMEVKEAKQVNKKKVQKTDEKLVFGCHDCGELEEMMDGFE